jgi:flagellar basal-body rod modification protein FlgD
MSSFDTTLSGLGVTRYSGAAGTDTSKLGKTEMDQSDFLTLMTAQLKNQDPFAPVDNTQMVAQMAQFSSLSGITEMSSTLKAIAAKLNGTSLGDAIGYVGKTVLTEGTTAYPRAAGGLAGAVSLANAATDVSVTIKNAAGEVLHRVDMGAQSAGAVAWDWDGTTDAGEPAGAGPFTVSVSARDAKGAVKATPLVWAPVSAVAMGADGAPTLTLPGIGNVPLTAVWQVG